LWGIFRGATYNNEGETSVKRALLTCVLIATTTILALTGLATSAGEVHYRWIDDRGRPVHSDRPPPKGVDYEVISTGSSLVRAVEADEGAVPLEITPRVGNDFEQVDTKKVAKIEKNLEYCKRAQENLQTLNSSARIRLRNDQGEYRYIDEEEKEIQRQNAMDTIAVHCD
jgi:hypothetical protein